MKKPEPPALNSPEFIEYKRTVLALYTISNQVERGRRYRQALVKLYPDMAKAFLPLNLPYETQP